jgi:hypothetical protein
MSDVGVSILLPKQRHSVSCRRYVAVDKLPELFLSRDINHIVQHPNQRNTPHSIIPDIHAYNVPSKRQNINDSGASQTDEAIFEVTMRMCAKTAVERQTHEVNQKSSRAFKQLDVKFAPEIVGNGSNGIVGPSEAIHGRFYQKQIIVFCAGAFAEINEDGKKLIKRLAKISDTDSCGGE